MNASPYHAGWWTFRISSLGNPSLDSTPFSPSWLHVAPYASNQRGKTKRSQESSS